MVKEKTGEGPGVFFKGSAKQTQVMSLGYPMKN